MQMRCHGDDQNFRLFSIGKSNSVLFLGRKFSAVLTDQSRSPADFKSDYRKPFHRKSPPTYREIKKFLTKLFLRLI